MVREYMARKREQKPFVRILVKILVILARQQKKGIIRGWKMHTAVRGLGSGDIIYTYDETWSNGKVTDQR